LVSTLAGLALLVGACGSSSPAASVSAPSSAATAAVSSAASAAAASAPAASAPAAAPSADPILLGALGKLNGLTSYRFKMTVKGGSYATSVGPAGIVGTVINKPSFAVQFTYSDTQYIEVQGKNWMKNGGSWDLNPYANVPTTYDSYGPAIQLGRFFDATVASFCTPVGEETIDGVAALHYKINPKILNMMIATWGVTAANGKADGLTQAGDIWIAKDGGYPVRWHVTATGGAAVSGSGGSADFDYLIDITKANDAGNKVAVPAS
jgi:hypothetical protein